MTLIFGNMTQDFVSFSSVQNEYYQSLQSNNSTAIEQAQAALDAAASAFVHNASLDASYLVYLGKFMIR
jgi:ATP-binding cassette subfamily B (MDR/TAP) protein 1